MPYGQMGWLSVLVFLAFACMAQESVAVAPAKPAAAMPGDKEQTRTWLGLDFNIGWYSEAKQSPIVTTGPLRTGLANVTLNGALGQVGTQVMVDDNVQDSEHLGAQLVAGGWVTSDRRWGVQAGGFFLDKGDQQFQTSAESATVLGLTYHSVSVFLGVPDNTERAFDLSGSALLLRRGPSSLELKSDTQMWGTELAGLYRLINRERMTLDLQFGFRQLCLDEKYELGATFTRPRSYFQGTLVWFGDFALNDAFETQSSFYGALAGTTFKYRIGPATFSLNPRISLGASVLDTEVSGGSSASSPIFGFGTRSTNTGFYTNANNIGDHQTTDFAVVPELSGRVDIRIVKNLSFHVGGQMKYWSCVARASEQLDRRVDRQNAALLDDYDASAVNASPKFKTQTSDLLNYGGFAGFTLRF